MGVKPLAILWTVTAEDGLDRLLGHIETENALAARKLWTRVLAALQHAALHPHLAPHIPEPGTSYRQILTVRPFRIIYRVEGELLRIIAVLRQEQDFDPGRFVT